MFNNYTKIPTDYVRAYYLDGNGNSTTGTNNASPLNAVWIKSDKLYQAQCLSWGASTSLTYTSVTYTNSYIWIYASGIWTFTKNSSKVTATALNGVNGERYAGLKFYNRTLTSEEERALELEGQRQLGNGGSYPNLLSGLVGYWDFRGDASNLVDGVAGTVSGATLTTDRFGNSNSAYSFGNDNKYITVAHNSNNTFVGNHTINTIVNLRRFRTNATANESLIISKGTYPTYNYRINSFATLNDYQGGFIVGAYDGDFKFYTTPMNSTYPPGLYMLTQVLENGNLKLYINGVYHGQTTGIGTLSNNTYNPVFGKFGSGPNYAFDGNIEEVEMFNRALSSNEVKALYDLTSQDYIYPSKVYDLPNLRDGLVAEFNGSNNGTTTIYDISGNGKNGTVSSTPTYKRQGRVKTISLTNQSISWTSTSFSTAICFEKVSGKWTLVVNPAYMTTTGVTSGTREITDIRLYNRTLSTKEQEQLKYSKLGNFIY